MTARPDGICSPRSTTRTPVALGQVDVEAKTHELPMFSTLPGRMDLTDAVVTADAMHAHRAHAEDLTGRGAHYVLTVKRNQPSLHAHLGGAALEGRPHRRRHPRPRARLPPTEEAVALYRQLAADNPAFLSVQADGEVV